MIRVGILGNGRISVAHRNGWLKIPEAKVTAVCDILPEKAEEAAKALDARPYLSFEEMMEKEELDILDICLPTYLHVEYALKALNAGLHVLCEKPLSLHSGDAALLYETAKKNHKNVMIAQCVRFWPEYEEVKAACDSQKYGRLLSGHMLRLSSMPDNWMADPALSGLVPFDMHIHDLDFLVYAFGKPDSFQYRRVGPPDQDYISVLYAYKDFFVTTETAWYKAAYPFQCGFRFQFENAVMELKDGTLTTCFPDGKKEVFADDKEAGGDGYIPSSDAYYREIRYFVDCVLNDQPCDKIKAEELDAVLSIAQALQ